jgi:hypothetical protein
MKSVQMVIIFMFFGLISNGQKYEIWMYSKNISPLKKGVLDSSNDSVLSLKYKPKSILVPFFLIPYNYEDFRWDEINDLKIRNKTAYDIATIIGASVGALAGYAIFNNWYKKQEEKDNFGLMYAIPIVGGIYVGGAMGAGFLAGHMITSAKISIPLNGKSALEKNQALREKLKRKNN